MYCLVCGGLINDNAEICVKCGCRPYNGREYCPNCGTRTNERQEMCVNCGVMLNGYALSTRTRVINSEGERLNLDFSYLSPYYQEEFTKIYESGEEYKGKFNICAFLFGCIWAFSKGLWLAGIVSIILSILTGGVAGVVYWFIFGIRGNYMYYRDFVKNNQTIF